MQSQRFFGILKYLERWQAELQRSGESKSAENTKTDWRLMAQVIHPEFPFVKIRDH